MTVDSPYVQAGFALLASIIFLTVSLRRSKRLEKADAGSVFVALGAGFAVPKGLFLCSYFFEPDPPAVITKLHGYEKDIFVAGVLVVFLALASIWSLCEKLEAKPSNK